VPAPAKSYLAVFNPVGFDVQDVPSYSSVAPVLGGLSPPNAKAAVCIPAPPKTFLAVFKVPPAVQDVPSYSSVTSGRYQSEPPKAKAAV
jgi:hypothetical protein